MPASSTPATSFEGRSPAPRNMRATSVHVDPTATAVYLIGSGVEVNEMRWWSTTSMTGISSSPGMPCAVSLWSTRIMRNGGISANARFSTVPSKRPSSSTTGKWLWALRIAAGFTSWTRSVAVSTCVQAWSGASPVGRERSSFAMKSERSFAGESIPRKRPSAPATGRDDSPEASSVRRASMSGISAEMIGTSGAIRSRTRT